MFSRAKELFLPECVRKRRPLHYSHGSNGLSNHQQTYGEHEYLRNVTQELNNVAVDLYSEGDHSTALDLYKDAAKVLMLKNNNVVTLNDDLRARIISQIVRGKQQLYQSTLTLRSSNGALDSYQWTESDDDSSPRFLSEAIKIEANKRQHPDEYINNAIIMYNTALIYMKRGELEIAKYYFALVVECFDSGAEERELHNTSNSALSMLVFSGLFNNIGCLQYIDGNITSAIENFAKALEIGKNAPLRQTCGNYKKKMIQGYKHVGTIYYNIGVINAWLGFKDEVIRPLERSLGYQKVALGENHPDIAIVQHNIGAVLVGAGHLDDAMNAFLESLRIIRFVNGNDEYQVAKELFHVGKVHEMKGEYDEALHVYQETLQIERLKLGMTHPETVMTMYEIVQIYHNKGDLNEALNVCHDILLVARTADDFEESSLDFLLCQMVTICLEMGNTETATKICTEISSTIELNNIENTVADIVKLAQIKYLLVNPPAAAAA